MLLRSICDAKSLYASQVWVILIVSPDEMGQDPLESAPDLADNGETI
jgi:hypothetical protein